MFWPLGFGTPLQLQGRARDLLTPRNTGATPVVTAEATLTARVSLDRTIEAIEVTPDRAGIAGLVGSRGGGGFRKEVDRVLPGERESGSALYLLLDDIAGSTLISVFAWSRSGMDWTERTRVFGMEPEEIERHRLGMENICSGFRTGSSVFHPDAPNSHNVAAVPPLGDVTDPWSWHDAGDHPAVAMRRARRIDVWGADDELVVDAMFRDSCWTPDGTEVAVHEYRLDATVDRSTMILTSVAAEQRVLPYPECNGAAANAAWMVGAHAGDLRTEVLARLRSIDCCTHLNDALRSLAELPALVAVLDEDAAGGS